MSIGLNWWRAISIGTIVTTLLFLIGFLKMLNLQAGESMYGTGLTPEILLSIGLGLTFFAIYEKKL